MSSTPLTPVTEDLAEPNLELPAQPTYGLLARLGAELIGTFVLVFIGVGVALYSGLSAALVPSGVGALGIGLGFGIAVIGAASAVGHVSGGHFNPAVSLGAAIAGKISWADLVPYWVAQVLGGVIGAAALRFTVPAGLPSLLSAQEGAGPETFFSGASNGYDELSPLGRIGQQLPDGALAVTPLVTVAVIEVIATAIFVGVILGVTDRRARNGFGPVAIGLTLAALLTLTIPLSNGSLNPARSTATALFSGEALGQLWIFWLAPLVGAAIAGLVYVLVAPERVAPPSAVALGDEDAVEEGADSGDVARLETTVDGQGTHDAPLGDEARSDAPRTEGPSSVEDLFADVEEQERRGVPVADADADAHEAAHGEATPDASDTEHGEGEHGEGEPRRD